MKSRTVSLTAVVLALLPVTLLSSSPAAGQPAPMKSAAIDVAARAKTSGEIAATPSLMFIENVGQFAEGARFKVHGADRAFWLADDAIWITLLEPAPPADIHDRFAPDALMPPAEEPETPRRGVNLRLTFPGSNPNVELSAYQPVDTTISYFLGNDPEKWRPDVPVWAGVQYRDLYRGLDLVWDSSGEAASMSVICRLDDCAATLADVQLRVEGADELDLHGDGLLIRTAAGDFHLPLLIIQDAAGRPLPVAALTPRLQGDSIAAPYAVHAPALPVPATPANDPSDLLYSTFLGGNDKDVAYEMALDAAGNATVTGYTWSGDFPSTPGAFDASHSVGNDIFISRVNGAGSALLYSTFLGGTYDDVGLGVAVDVAGNATITGFVSSYDFPVTDGAFDVSYNGDMFGDGFVMRLNAAGSALLYSTFLGGSEGDQAVSVALDSAGNATIAGFTDSSDFPTTAGAFDTTQNGQRDAFIARLNAAGSALIYSSFLGGSDQDIASQMTLDSAGNATIAGSTKSTDFPTTAGAYDTSYNGGIYDIFVTRLNPAGSALLYSTFVGGSNSEDGSGLAMDAAGNVTFTGSTVSNDFPTTAGAFDTSYNGGDYLSDVFVTRLNPTGSALIYSTFLGGSDDDYGNCLALDALGNATFVGETRSKDFPITADAFDTSQNGDVDVFVTRLNSAGSDLLYSTFFGGTSSEAAYSLALDSSGSATFTGTAYSLDFPITAGAYDTSQNGNWDVFISRLSLDGRVVFLPLIRK